MMRSLHGQLAIGLVLASAALTIAQSQIGDNADSPFYDPSLAGKTYLEKDGPKEALSTVSSPDSAQQGFMLSFLMIIVSEVGDKTFLIAAIMAMKHSRLVVFAGAFSSLFLMSVLSAFLGHVVPNLLPAAYTTWLAALLFFCFGIKMLSEAYKMKGDEAQEEMAEVEEELMEAEDRDNLRKINTEEVGGLESPHEKKTEQLKDGVVNLMQLVFSPVFVQTFILTFLGEWGDRSQISTIALAAANNVYWVTLGVVVGHSICTFVAVMGGRYLASKISVKTVTYTGAVLFIIFGFVYLYEASHPEAAQLL